MAKANPRIPLPIMALLRLKMDMPNEVFPSNCSESTTEDVTQINQFMNQNSTLSVAFHVPRFTVIELTLTSVKWISFLAPVLWGRNSCCSAKSSNLRHIVKVRTPLLQYDVHISNYCSFVTLTHHPCYVQHAHSSSEAPCRLPNHQTYNK